MHGGGGVSEGREGYGNDGVDGVINISDVSLVTYYTFQSRTTLQCITITRKVSTYSR